MFWMGFAKPSHAITFCLLHLSSFTNNGWITFMSCSELSGSKGQGVVFQQVAKTGAKISGL